MKRLALDLLNWFKQPLNLAATVAALIPMYMVALYMQTYGRNVPVNDHWLFGIKIATATKNGTLSLDVILQDFAGHRIFFTGSLHALLTYFTNWNTVYEMYVNLPLAIGEFVVLVFIFRKTYPQLTAIALLPFSLLTFSVYQYLNWLNGFYTIWHFVPLFFLLSILALQYLSGWKAVSLAIFLAFCATFSLGPGVVVWVTVLIGMVLFGYRDWRHYAAVLVTLGITLYLYTREVQVEVGGESGGFSSLRFAPLNEMATFFFTFLGNPFTAEYDHIIASRLALAGVGILSLNLVYLWRTEKNLRVIAPWLTMMMFAFGVAGLITITRYVEFRWITALEQRYTVISSQMWLAWIATCIIVVWQIGQIVKPAYWQRGLMVANLGLGLLVGSYYVRANLWNWQATAQRYSEKIALPYDDFDEEDCILQYPLTRDETCIKETFAVQLGNAHTEQVYQVAAYKLTIFAEQDSTNILPASYQPADPIILDSPSRWLNVYIRDWLLEGVKDDSLFHIAPPEEFVFTAELPHPLGENILAEPDYSDNSPVAEFIGESARVWYLYTSETAEHYTAFDEWMAEQGFVPLYIPIQTAPYSTGDFTLIRYRRAPEQTETLFTFGETITLQAFEVVTGETVNPCEVIQVESWWQVSETPTINYSATLILANEAGEKVANVDGSPAGIEMGVWEAGLLYPDDRSLTVPCDLPAGEYTLRVGLYDSGNFADLPVLDAEGNEVGNRGVLTTIQVK